MVYTFDTIGLNIDSAGFSVYNGAYDNETFDVGTGTYTLTFSGDFVPFPGPGEFSAVSSLGCQTIFDTVTVPDYSPPVLAYASIVECNGDLVAILNPDSNHGAQPFEYQIINGPQTFPLQESNVFTLTKKGTYIARIVDTCGFGETFTFIVDTVTLPVITVGGSLCLGSDGVLAAQPSPYFFYEWFSPHGHIYYGPDIGISPVTSTDTGLYRILRTTYINGCVDSDFTTYRLSGVPQTKNINATICPGNSFPFAGVNYNSTGVYTDTFVTSTCDSIVILNLKVQNPMDSVAEHICAGQSIAVGTNTYTQSGIYRDTFSTSTCDSIHVLNLTVNSWPYDSVSQSICTGQSVIVGLHTYSQTGTYRDTLPTTACDSIHILNLTVNPVSFDSVAMSICNGQGVTVGGHTYFLTGIYRDTLPTTSCDSIHVLNLTVNPLPYDSIAQSICNGQSVIVGVHSYSQTGIYRDTLPTTACDSIHVLDLTVNSLPYDSVSQSVCNGQSVMVGSHTYFQTGIYRDTFPTPACDSIHVLNLSVNPLLYDSISQSICNGQSIMVGLHTYSQTGIYRDTLPTSACDSIHVLNLTVNLLPYDSVSQSVCNGQSIAVGVHTYSQAGIYRDTLPTTGCDSIHVLNLAIKPAPQVSISTGNDIFCSGDSIQLCATPGFVTYQWNPGATGTDSCIEVQQAGAYYVSVTDTDGCTAESAPLVVNVYPVSSVSIVVRGDTLSSYDAVSYQWYFSDTLIAGATGQIYIAGATGNYSLQITDTNGCVVMSNPLYVVVAGVIDLAEEPVLLYPNPNSSASVELVVGSYLIGSQLEMFDAEGRLVYQSLIRNLQSEIAIGDLPGGVYFLHISSLNKSIVRKLVRF